MSTIDEEYPNIIKEMQDALCRIERKSKERMGLPTEPEDDVTNIKHHLEDTLRMLADDVVHYNVVISDADRKARLDVIGDFVAYIRDYEQNKELLARQPEVGQERDD